MSRERTWSLSLVKTTRRLYIKATREVFDSGSRVVLFGYAYRLLNMEDHLYNKLIIR